MKPPRFLFVGAAALLAYAGHSIPVDHPQPPLRRSRLQVATVPIPLAAQAYLASAIVHGVVANVAAELVSDGAVATRVEVNVLECIKGKAARTTTVRYLGGTKDGHQLDVPAAPQLQRGDEVVLFLTQSGDEVPGILGLRQGTVQVQHAGDRSFVRGGNANDGERLGAFLDRVRESIVAPPAVLVPQQEGK